MSFSLAPAALDQPLAGPAPAAGGAGGDEADEGAVAPAGAGRVSECVTGTPYPDRPAAAGAAAGAGAWVAAGVTVGWPASCCTPPTDAPCDPPLASRLVIAGHSATAAAPAAPSTAISTMTPN